MQHIETIELTSSQSSITFSSIPQSYDDLIVVTSLRSDRNQIADVVRMSVNGGSFNTTNINLQGDGSSAISASFAGMVGQVSGNTSTANTFNNMSVYVSNYSSTTSTKSFSSDSVMENNGTTGIQNVIANLYNSTTAITELKFEPDAGTNFLTGSSASLYGITAGGSGTVTKS